MNLFLHNLPTDALALMRSLLLMLCLFAVIILPMMAAEGCVKRPLEPAPGAAPQRLLNP